MTTSSPHRMRQRGHQIERQGSPTAVLEDQQERSGRGDRLERLTDLAKHSLLRRTEDLLLQGLTMLSRHERRDLHKPVGA
jgi:hypothetical protein